VIANLLNIFEGPQGIFILLIILLLFGAKKLPELARGMGKAIKEFQKAKDEFTDELHKSQNEPPKQPPASTIARSDNQLAGSVTQPDPNQSVAPGDKAGQV
jgi:sec-independent protein translocase protein TatA